MVFPLGENPFPSTIEPERERRSSASSAKLTVAFLRVRAVPGSNAVTTITSDPELAPIVLEASRFTVNLPGVVGVPEIVAPSKVSPSGNPDTAREIGAVPATCMV
jgi:hypothetical protein